MCDKIKTMMANYQKFKVKINVKCRTISIVLSIVLLLFVFATKNTSFAHAMSVSSSIANSVSTSAANDFSMDYIVTPETGKYKLLKNPVAVGAFGSGFLIADDCIVMDDKGAQVLTLPAPPVKLMTHLTTMFALIDNNIISYDLSVQTPTANAIASGAIDFALDSNATLYVLKKSTLEVHYSTDNYNSSSKRTFNLSNRAYPTISARAIAVNKSGIYIAVRSQSFAQKDDICSFNAVSEVLTPIYTQSDKIARLVCAADSTQLIALTASHITTFDCKSGLSIYSQIDGTAVNIEDGKDRIWYIDSLNSVGYIDKKTGEKNFYFASASNQEGYFNSPRNVQIKNGKIFVTDVMNSRIAEFTESNAKYITEHVPSRVYAVTADNQGRLYYAEKLNTITRVDNSGTAVSFTMPDNDTIISLSSDASNNIYVLGDKGLYKLDNNSNTIKMLYQNGSSPITAFTVKIGTDIIYTLNSQNTVTKAQGSPIDVDVGALSIAVDREDNIFVLKRDRIVKFTQGVMAKEFIFPSEFVLNSDNCDFAISTIANKFVSYGEAVIADTNAHRVLVTKNLGASVVDDGFTPPIVDDDIATNDTNLAENDKRIIRTALRDLEVFERPIPVGSTYVVESGRNVIVANYDIPESDEFSLILIDNTKSGKLVTGYVYKNGLSAAKAYSAPAQSAGTVIYPDTSIYKWPSKHSKTVVTAQKYAEYTLMDFVSGYTDDYSVMWYRVSINGANGYIPATDVTLENFEPFVVAPAYNATVVNAPDLGAPCYSLENESYNPTGVLLLNDTRVEVVGLFDSSERYTQIKYLDTNLNGIVTCYIETKYLKADETDKVTIIAITVACVTAVLAVVIVLLSVYYKKRNTHKISK